MRLPRLVIAPRAQRNTAACGMILALGVLSGCDVPSFIDPGELSGLRRNAREPLPVQILEDLDPTLEQGTREFANAQPPRPEDLETSAADYVIGPGDVLQVTVYDLEQQGLQTVKTVQVSGTGNITLPYLKNVVRVEGLTDIEVQDAVGQAYSQAGVLEGAQVSVSVIQPRNNAYSVSGAVAREGFYVITDNDFRLTDALTQAGGVNSPFLDDVYIFRRTDEVIRRQGPGEGGPTTRPAGQTQPAVDDLAPQGNAGPRRDRLAASVLLQEQGGEAPAESLEPDTAEAGAAVVEDDDAAARVGRIDGQQVVVQPADDEPADQPADADEPVGVEGQLVGGPMPSGSTGSFEFNELSPPDNIRVIRVPWSKLRAGEFQYNVAIRPRDRIVVPPGQVGFYYMGGHVGSPGAYAFQGQKVTLKQAVNAARGLDGLAIPQRTDVIRRVGPNQEVFYRVDLARIFAGESPDFYLKPNDHVTVGTNFLAPFLAAIRGGFRMTYGFGFLYDRNFAYDQDDQRR